MKRRRRKRRREGNNRSIKRAVKSAVEVVVVRGWTWRWLSSSCPSLSVTYQRHCQFRNHHVLQLTTDHLTTALVQSKGGPGLGIRSVPAAVVLTRVVVSAKPPGGGW